MVAQICFYFVNFHLVLLFCATIMKFGKWLSKIGFCFLSFEFYLMMKFKEEKYGKLCQRESERQLPKKHLNVTFACFGAHKYNFINNFYVKFVYEDDATPSWFLLYNLVFSDKNNQIAKILHMWIFVPQKFWQNHEILMLVWILTVETLWPKWIRCMTFGQAIVF